MYKRYVLIAVFNPSLTHMVCLTKLKGPAFLIGKKCFVGGHVEEGEQPVMAAVRELKEEAGLVLSPESLVQFGFLQRTDAEMTSFVGISDDLFAARQCDVEPIHILSASVAEVEANPQDFAPDFLDTLTAALAKLSVKN